MCGDSLESPYCRFFRLVVLDMVVEDLVVVLYVIRLVVVNGAKEFDPGGIVFYLPVMIFNCLHDACSKSLSILHWVHQECPADKVAGGMKNGHGRAWILFVSITGIRLVTRFYDDRD
jgi:hypothetical protein